MYKKEIESFKTILYDHQTIHNKCEEIITSLRAEC
jgi:hypothetical protein